MRFEEVDTDSDGGHGVTSGRHFKSDELHFTGADMGRHTHNRERHNYSDNTDDSDGLDDYYDERNGNGMQVVLREKEDVLVERALARIRRAQELGRPDVQLTEPERDALERKIQIDRAKGKKPPLKKKGSSESTRGSPKKSLAPAGKRKSSKSSLKKNDEPAGPPVPPGLVVAGPDGRPLFTPIGYYPPASSRPNSRSNSVQNLQLSQPPASQAQYRSLPKRYSSSPSEHQYPSSNRPSMPARPLLPEDPDWRPRSRSSSIANLAYPFDSYHHPYPPPQLPPRYNGRRNVSGPAELGYPDPRSYDPSLAPRGYTSSSDPTLVRREYSGGSGHNMRGGFASEDDDDDEDDEEGDEGSGVLVDVVPYGSGYEVNVSSSRGQQGPASGSAGASTGRARKGRR